MYFGTKSYLKSTRNHNAKHVVVQTLKQFSTKIRWELKEI
jgi:hypothetical protein